MLIRNIIKVLIIVVLSYKRVLLCPIIEYEKLVFWIKIKSQKMAYDSVP